MTENEIRDGLRNLAKHMKNGAKLTGSLNYKLYDDMAYCHGGHVTAACAIGAAMVSACGNQVEAGMWGIQTQKIKMKRAFPFLAPENVFALSLSREVGELQIGADKSLWNEIATLNNKREWSREKIAERIRKMSYRKNLLNPGFDSERI